MKFFNLLNPHNLCASLNSFPPHDAERLATSGTGVDGPQNLGGSEDCRDTALIYPSFGTILEEANRAKFKQSVQQVVLVSMKK